MTETFDIVLLGLAVSLSTQLAKRFDISPRIVATSLVIVSAAGYTAFNSFVDRETQTSVIMFATAMLGTAQLFYSVVIKNMVK